jgi:hypothetical protein
LRGSDLTLKAQPWFLPAAFYGRSSLEGPFQAAPVLQAIADVPKFQEARFYPGILAQKATVIPHPSRLFIETPNRYCGVVNDVQRLYSFDPNEGDKL